MPVHQTSERRPSRWRRPPLAFATRLLDETSCGHRSRGPGFGSVRLFNDAFLRTTGAPRAAARHGPRGHGRRRRGALRMAYGPKTETGARPLAARAPVPGWMVDRRGTRARWRRRRPPGGCGVSGEDELELRVRGSRRRRLTAAFSAGDLQLAADPAARAALGGDPLWRLSWRWRAAIPGRGIRFEWGVLAVLSRSAGVRAARRGRASSTVSAYGRQRADGLSNCAGPEAMAAANASARPERWRARRVHARPAR